MYLKIVCYSFLACLCLLPIAMFAAKYVGLVDRPTARKQHTLPTPSVGGVSIFLAMCLCALLVPGTLVSWSMLGWVGVVLAVGMLDDLSDISHRVRLFVHAVVVVGIALSDGLYVSGIGAVTGTVDIKFAEFSLAIFFTIVGVLGAVNAVNMSDGLDGLLGSLCVISFFAVLFLLPTDSTAVTGFSSFVIWSLLGSLACFLCFNARIFFPKGRVFLGDAGSTVLGFLLVYTLMYYTQGETRVFSPVLAGWILGLPLMDASAVIATRLLKGKSPFAADRSHLHHILLDYGFSVNAVVSILAVFHSLMIAVAVVVVQSGLQNSDMILFWGFVAVVVLRVGFVNRLQSAEKARLAKYANVQVGKSVGVSEMTGLESIAKNSRTTVKTYEPD